MLEGYQFSNGQLLVKQTGARINLDNHFMKEAAAVASFTVEVAAISAARAARSKIRIGGHPGERRIRICFLPGVPQVWYSIWSVVHLSNIEPVRDPAQADILFYFDDREMAEAVPTGLPPTCMINDQCLDIRKSRVATIFEEVFGYSLSIDPRNHAGLALMKSERNGVHDGQVTPCPYAVPPAGKVFQRLIDNTRDGKVYTDIRTPVVGQSLSVVYLKHRTAASRFSNDNVAVELTTAAEQFSAGEQAKILGFALKIGLDFGGLDILRDRRDGRIYIVDVNKTDMGPPTALPRPQKLVAMQKLADTFRNYVLDLLENGRAQ